MRTKNVKNLDPKPEDMGDENLKCISTPSSDGPGETEIIIYDEENKQAWIQVNGEHYIKAP